MITISSKQLFKINWKMHPEDYENLKALLNTDFSKVHTSITGREEPFYLPWLELEDVFVGLVFEFNKTTEGFNLYFQLADGGFGVTMSEITSINFDLESKTVFILKDFKENEYHITLSISDKELKLSDYKTSDTIEAIGMLNSLLQDIHCSE